MNLVPVLVLAKRAGAPKSACCGGNKLASVESMSCSAMQQCQRYLLPFVIATASSPNPRSTFVSDALTEILVKGGA